MLGRRLKIFQLIAGLVVVLGVMWIAPDRIESALAARESGDAATGSQLLADLVEKFGATDLINGADMKIAPERLPPSIAELYQAHTTVDVDMGGIESDSTPAARGSGTRHGSSRVKNRTEKAHSRTRSSRRFSR